ncbi:hypothetical protein BDN67DRAFT_427882 [Paxillus ammoniavirescens]|nr:hypothetical protein BDN67DRAFT_427882 [Paxillus ammoniavirescens]
MAGGSPPLTEAPKQNHYQARLVRPRQAIKTVDGTEDGDAEPDSSRTPAGNTVIRTRPKLTVAIALSGAENRPQPYSPPTPAGLHNQPESIEIVAIPQNSTVSADASPQCTSSTIPLSPAVASFNLDQLLPGKSRRRDSTRQRPNTFQ